MQPLRALGSTSRFLLQPIHRTLASHAYIPPSPSPTASHSKPQIGSGPSSSSTAAITTPSLSPDQHEVISQIIRVDQAGELGANWIYRGQKWAMGVRGDRETEKEIEVGDALLASISSVLSSPFGLSPCPCDRSVISQVHAMPLFPFRFSLLSPSPSFAPSSSPFSSTPALCISSAVLVFQIVRRAAVLAR